MVLKQEQIWIQKCVWWYVFSLTFYDVKVWKLKTESWPKINVLSQPVYTWAFLAKKYKHFDYTKKNKRQLKTIKGWGAKNAKHCCRFSFVEFLRSLSLCTIASTKQRALFFWNTLVSLDSFAVWRKLVPNFLFDIY